VAIVSYRQFSENQPFFFTARLYSQMPEVFSINRTKPPTTRLEGWHKGPAGETHLTIDNHYGRKKESFLMKIWKLFKEPLIHFLTLGALLFILHSAVNGSGVSEQHNRIVISDSEVEWLQGAWSKKWRREPTERELKNLIKDYVREEILYREALAMGLDDNDTIIRRRLATKMEFLAKDLGQLIKPTAKDLKEFFETNQERYREPSRISFSHVYFSPDRRASADSDARLVLASFQESEPSPDDAWQQGDRFMLHYEYPKKTHTEIMQLFGKSFADAIFKTAAGVWQGPVMSGYGLHLVYIIEQVEGRVPDLSEVRTKVYDDLVDQRRRQVYEAYCQKLHGKYQIVITATGLSEQETNL
jgi:hypothetical protein